MAEPTKAQLLAELAALKAANQRLKAEKVRLVYELETRSAALRISVEQQTATSEILRVISNTQTDLEPILETIARNAGRVCEAVDAVIVVADKAETVVAAHWASVDTQNRPHVDT